MAVQPVVLITGASSGVGQATARLLSDKGYKVFGTSRTPRGSESVVEMVPLDVRNDDSVTTCVKSVLDKAGRIDVLINNAGYELSGALEETSLDEARAQFDTNFVGVVRMVKNVWRQRAFNAFRAFEETAPGSDLVAEALLEIVSSPSPRLRYLIGPQAKATSRLMRLLPAGMYEQGKRRAFKLDKPR